MRIVIYGAGALGCFFGARLQQGGHHVTYIARGAHLEAMQRDGLRIESPSGVVHLSKVEATDDVGEVGAADLIFFAVKNYDVLNAAATLPVLMGPETAILTVQNGLWAQAFLEERFGAERLLPGVVIMPADIKSPGTIRAPTENNPDMLTFGPAAGGTSERAEALREAFVACGVPAKLSDDIWRRLWEKFIRLTAFSAATVAMRLDIGAVRETEAARELLRSLVEETTRVAQASHDTIAPNEAQIAFDFLMGLPAHIHASMLDDLLRGKPIELDWLSGDVVRRGRDLGIPTPAHEFIHAVLSPFVAGRPEGSH